MKLKEAVKREKLRKEGYKETPKGHKIDTKTYDYRAVSFDLFYKLKYNNK